MRTPREVRETLAEADRCYQNDDTDAAVSVLIGLFYDVLPDLVAHLQKSEEQDMRVTR